MLFDLYSYGLWLVIWPLLLYLTILPTGTFTSYIPQELNRASLPKHATLFQVFKSDICNFFYMEFFYLPCPSRFSVGDYFLFCMNFVSYKSVKIYYHNFLVFFSGIFDLGIHLLDMCQILNKVGINKCWMSTWKHRHNSHGNRFICILHKLLFSLCPL